MSIIIDTIASEVGVSPRVVSMVLNGGRSTVSASPITRQRVNDAARRLGYRSNLAAQSTRTGRFNAVGLLMSTTSYLSALQGELLRGIHDVLESRGLHLTVTYVNDERLASDDGLPKVLKHEMVDGLLLNYTHNVPEQMGRIITRDSIPSVWMNSRQKDNCAYIDDEGAAFEATRRLLDLGHRRVLFVDYIAGSVRSPLVHYSHHDRRGGFERAMREAGLPAPVLVPVRGSRGADGIAESVRLLRSPDRPTAVVSYCAEEVITLVAACHAVGLAPGRDLSLITFDQAHTPMGVHADLYALPHHELGRTAATDLVSVLAGTKTKLPPRPIPMVYRPGQTLMPPVL